MTDMRTSRHAGPLFLGSIILPLIVLAGCSTVATDSTPKDIESLRREVRQTRGSLVQDLKLYDVLRERFPSQYSDASKERRILEIELRAMNDAYDINRKALGEIGEILKASGR